MAAFDRKLVKREETTATVERERQSWIVLTRLLYDHFAMCLSICPSNVPPDSPRPNFSLPQCVPV